jgi:hypothetical protein
MGSGCGVRAGGVEAGGVEDGGVGVGWVLVVGVVARYSDAPQPESTELAATAANPCSNWRRETGRWEIGGRDNVGSNACEAMETFPGAVRWHKLT